MRSRIRNTMMILCFALILSFVSCSNTRVDEKKHIYIGVTCYDQKDTFIGELIETFKKECASLDTDKYDISMTIMDAAGSQRAQDDQVQDMIEDGCNVLCINLADRTDLSHIINAAMEKDIPIIFFNREPVDEDLNRWDKLYYVGAKAKQSGQMQGELIADYIKNNPGVDKNGDGRIQYVILEGEMGHQDAIVRTESVTESTEAVKTDATEGTENGADGSVSDDDILNSVKQDNEVTFDFDSEEDNSAPVSYITYVIYK